jgi:hypothetical protein
METKWRFGARRQGGIDLAIDFSSFELCGFAEASFDLKLPRGCCVNFLSQRVRLGWVIEEFLNTEMGNLLEPRLDAWWVHAVLPLCDKSGFAPSRSFDLSNIIEGQREKNPMSQDLKMIEVP